MLCLKWAVSTGVIFSLTSCDYKSDQESFFKKQGKKLVIGTLTDLMAIDPYSVNSLGETFVKSLLYSQVFYIENNKFKSQYFKINFDGNALKIIKNKTDLVALKDINKAYTKLKNSALWKSALKGVSFSEKSGFVCEETKNCISKITGIIKLVKLKKLGAFSVLQFVKGQSLLLKNKKTGNIVYFVKMKDIEDGEKLLMAGKLDIVLPVSDLMSQRKQSLSYFHHKNKMLRLTLYKKFKQPLDGQFYRSLCDSKKTIDKVFKSWKSKYNICSDKRNITFHQKNKTIAVSNSNYLIKIFDIIKPKVTNNLTYEKKSSMELVKVLKNGNYDLYLSEEIFDATYPVLYSAFHSLGAFNSLQIKDKKLDSILEKASEAKTLQEFNTFSNLAKVRVNHIEPILFRFEKTFVEFIVKKKQKKISLKPTLFKTLEEF